MSRFQAGLKRSVFHVAGMQMLGGFYQAAGDTPSPTALLLHGLPGIEKHLDVAYALRDLGWNCLYFHFRGCWGSHGAYDLAGLADDTRAATDWVAQQPEVDPQRIVLIGASTGSHPAFVCGAADPRIRAIVGISPVIEPGAFQFPPEMASKFAAVLHGVTGPDLVSQWNALPSLAPALAAFSPRPSCWPRRSRTTSFHRRGPPPYRAVRTPRVGYPSRCRPQLQRVSSVAGPQGDGLAPESAGGLSWPRGLRTAIRVRRWYRGHTPRTRTTARRPGASPPRSRRAPSRCSLALEGRCLRTGTRRGRAGSARWQGVSRRVVRPAGTGGWWPPRRRFARHYPGRPPAPGHAPPRSPR